MPESALPSLDGSSSDEEEEGGSMRASSNGGRGGEEEGMTRKDRIMATLVSAHRGQGLAAPEREGLAASVHMTGECARRERPLNALAFNAVVPLYRLCRHVEERKEGNVQQFVGYEFDNSPYVTSQAMQPLMA